MSSGRKYLLEAYHAIFQNDFQKAIDAFNKAIRCEPTNASYYYKLSITYSRNGDMKEAIEAAKKACELQYNLTYRYHLQILQAKNLVMVAADLMKKGILTEEIENILIQAKTLDPLNIEAYLILGIYYGEKQRLPQAIKEFNMVFGLDPFHQQAKELREYYSKLYKEGD
ncbi:tetratricopeptide repeat protein [Tepidibacillus infernus]|uniref:Uncharacterized protein n=1 Tax=Tepidibacillus decaturensis TaxID=1413211 RepID=A0A135L3U0_9BACI|nr:tetratricopeptide repeat protein [Tepidibacillus decaturensis]KXG43620.1 hypothetical protein U473_06025 [Tepidibacillus decaturensis]